MQNKNVWIAIVVVAIIALGSYQFPKVHQTVNQVLGSVTGPDNPYECTSSNGLQTCKVRQALNVATTSVCSIKSPASTSTLVYTGLQVTTATGTAVTLHLATSTSGFATTTSLLTNPLTLASGAQGSYKYTGTTTPDTLVGNSADAQWDLMPPNTYVTWSAAGFIGADTTKFLGTCGAEFKVQ